jgi:uncharacterized membrane protein
MFVVTIMFVFVVILKISFKFLRRRHDAFFYFSDVPLCRTIILALLLLCIYLKIFSFFIVVLFEFFPL